MGFYGPGQSSKQSVPMLCTIARRLSNKAHTHELGSCSAGCRLLCMLCSHATVVLATSNTSRELLRP